MTSQPPPNWILGSPHEATGSTHQGTRHGRQLRYGVSNQLGAVAMKWLSYLI